MVRLLSHNPYLDLLFENACLVEPNAGGELLGKSASFFPAAPLAL
jgi:hypothetical protein